MRARSVRRTHPGVARTPILHRRRPREVARPSAAPCVAPDAAFVARIVSHMFDVHAADERVDRVLAGIVTRLQTQATRAR